MKKGSILFLSLFFLNLFSMGSEKIPLLKKSQQNLVLLSSDNTGKEHEIGVQDACFMSKTINEWIQNGSSYEMVVPFSDKILEHIIELMKKGYFFYHKYNSLGKSAWFLEKNIKCSSSEDENKKILTAMYFFDTPILFESLVLKVQKIKNKNLWLSLVNFFHDSYKKSINLEPQGAGGINDFNCIYFLLFFVPEFIQDVYLLSNGYEKVMVDDGIRRFIRLSIKNGLVSDKWINKFKGTELYCSVINSIIVEVKQLLYLDRKWLNGSKDEIKQTLREQIKDSFDKQTEGVVKNIIRFLYYKITGDYLDYFSKYDISEKLKQLDHKFLEDLNF